MIGFDVDVHGFDRIAPVVVKLGRKDLSISELNLKYPLNVDEVAGRAPPDVFAVGVNVEHSGRVTGGTLVTSFLNLDLLKGDELRVAGLRDELASEI